MDKKFNVYKKELYYDMDKNMFKLIDIDNKLSEKCGIYSEVVPKFKNYITGFQSNRKEINSEINLKAKDMYRPITTFYNGYFPFPRPKENIFNNLTIDKVKDNSKDKLSNLNNCKSNLKRNLKSAYTTTNFYKKYNDNLSVFNKKVHENNMLKNDEKYLQEYYKKHYNNKKNIYLDIEAANECRSISNCIKKLNFFSKQNKNLKSPSQNEINKFENTKNYVGAKVKMNDYLDLFKEKNKTASPIENKIFNHTFSDFKKNTINKNDKSKNNDNSMSSLDYSNLSNDSKNFNVELNKTYRDFGQLKFADKLVSNELQMLCKEKNEKYLKGFKDIPEKEKGIVNIKRNVHIKKETDYYLSNKQLLMKTNPIAFNVIEKKEVLDLKYLKRKLEDQKVKSLNLFGKEITDK
jgi:hypothetical protein